ncbi:MAG: (4Fe-4S)-binding protein [Flavobacteriaceae bacterium]
MSEKEIIKRYHKDDFTIVWKPRLCIHSALCVKELPEVYDPKSRPWIKQENASVEALKAQIKNCPSGALSYELENQEKEINMEDTKVELRKNGPLLVHGNLTVTDSEGNIEKKERLTAFCRCGASENKPYCDGTHKTSGFEG